MKKIFFVLVVAVMSVPVGHAVDFVAEGLPVRKTDESVNVYLQELTPAQRIIYQKVVEDVRTEKWITSFIHCEGIGGKVVERKIADNIFGVCQLPAGGECDLWALFDGLCSVTIFPTVVDGVDLFSATDLFEDMVPGTKSFEVEKNKWETKMTSEKKDVERKKYEKKRKENEAKARKRKQEKWEKVQKKKKAAAEKAAVIEQSKMFVSTAKELFRNLDKKISKKSLRDVEKHVDKLKKLLDAENKDIRALQKINAEIQNVQEKAAVKIEEQKKKKEVLKKKRKEATAKKEAKKAEKKRTKKEVAEKAVKQKAEKQKKKKTSPKSKKSWIWW